MQDFKNLKVWERAHRLTVEIYVRTRTFPREEMFGLTSQLRRCANSIGANIAEGCGRGSDSDFGRFLQMAVGSASELQHHLLLAKDLNLVTAEEYGKFDNEAAGVKKMLSALIERTRSKPSADSRQPTAEAAVQGKS